MTIGFTYYHVRNSPLKNLALRLGLRKTVLELAAEAGIEGFTLVPVMGAWQGKTEPSYQMQLEGVATATGLMLAEKLRNKYEQDAVMVKAQGKVRFV